MEKIWKFISKHKSKLIVILVVLVVLIILLFAFKHVMKFLSPSTKESVYGDRCDAVLNIKVKQEDKDNIKNVVTLYENMELVDIKVECKLIDIIVNLKSDCEFAQVEEMSKKILESLPAEILENYDIQLFVTSSNKEDSNYPKIGTHHKKILGEMNDYFVW